ncbi:hypothetical protein NQ318_000678 [Aromia moschata]|uniref:Uncharacterized protein n=1 Tax=Aromia moschata TaxID=1265417 RepID=A0AAV8XVU5_9CUCU|nr:hypothetical protein NQ318_000678 [Aromia moschata]
MLRTQKRAKVKQEDKRIFKQNRILPFKPTFRHTLEEGDEAKRLDFCLEMGNIVLNERDFHEFCSPIIYFFNKVSSQHCRYWSVTNPHFILFLVEDNISKKVNVWCAVSYTNGIIGPYFFKENLNRNTYLEMLKKF